ncbi:glycosyltransferase family 1 protein [Candidatus Pacearchaeota archaeon]|nr:MAG: glycosyltransferase family 1 protein [Candidatus Pacearchaeota archaeon]
MRVLMFGWEFPPYNSGGLGTACKGLAKALAKKGAKIFFVMPRKVDVDADYLEFIFADKSKHFVVNSLLTPYSSVQSYAERYIEEKTSNSLYGQDLFEEIERYARVAESIASSVDFDVIHAHDWMTFKAACRAKKVSKKKLVVHVHATEFDRTGGNGFNAKVYEIEKQGLEEADKVIAVSNYTKRKIIEVYGIPEEKICVAHNGVEFENVCLERAHKLKEKNKIVLFVGRLTLQKGPDYFIYAAKKVLELKPNTIFLVAGSGDMECFLINKVAEMGIADRVLFTGFLRGRELSRAYAMADVYVMPSVSEPFGISPLEALTHQTPVLISKQSGVSEVLRHCLKADFWDIDEIANKIIAMLSFPELGDCMLENSQEELPKITWEKTAEKCMEVYSSLKW